MSTSYLGLNLSSSSSNRLAAPAAFLGWQWFYAYCVLSSRTWKQWYGIDHNGSPRQDLTKYAEVAIRDGKLTRAQVDQIKRVEAASANATEGFTLFAASVLFALITDVPTSSLINACTTYTIARLVYGVVYVFVEDDFWSQARGISWWTGNISCLFLLWKGAQSTS
ncbi:uncharacterized protein A1O9_03083 [Exophiala aquamarina CBS 119918]|uniref:Uncharacterized protein n=1 Tax=Exophiala aquamarina CBS 119918 TaxID=1182545 RepID=A0A072PNP8_9EURO|nr:uncharacterized protein A1O9_03083 [Exophiala aquamarina CBS 119918]KEF61516.1 hypothetical protein A1O9_03083 [Exophiala aquamarina CBS 119918]